MDLHPDFKDLLAEFARAKVSYAVLGGYAVGYHAKPRATKDLDLLLSGGADNLTRAATALAAFGAPANVVESVRTLKPTEICLPGCAAGACRSAALCRRNRNGISHRPRRTRSSK